MIGRFGQQGLLVGGADGGYIVVGARFQFLQVGFRGCPRIKHERQLLGLRGQYAQPFAHRLEKGGKGAHVRTRPCVEHMR